MEKDFRVPYKINFWYTYFSLKRKRIVKGEVKARSLLLAKERIKFLLDREGIKYEDLKTFVFEPVL